MENDNKKIITLSFVAAAALAGLLISTLIDVLAASSGTFSRIFSSTYAVHGVPVVFAIAVFAYLFLNAKISIWAEEVVVEIRRLFGLRVVTRRP